MNHKLDIDRRVCSICGIGDNDPDAVFPCPGPHAKVAEAMHAQGRTLQDARLKDSGSRSTFTSGANRDMQHGKGRMDLLPMRALIEVSKLYEAGATKYEPRNWESGIPIKAFISSGLRHLSNFMVENVDEAHLTQAVWNFLGALDTMLRIRDAQFSHEVQKDVLAELPFHKVKLMDHILELPNE